MNVNNVTPINIGKILPEVKLNESPIIRFWFALDPDAGNDPGFSFTYDFQKGLFMGINGIYEPEDIRIPYLESDSCNWGAIAQDQSVFLNIIGDTIEDSSEIYDEAELIAFKNAIESGAIKEICRRIWNHLTANPEPYF